MDNIDETSSGLSKKRKRKTTTKQSVSDLNQVKHSSIEQNEDLQGNYNKGTRGNKRGQ
jgi:hypothetical protein